MPEATAFDLDAALERYARDPDVDAAVVDLFRARLRAGGDGAWARDPALGHFTGSALVVSADGTRTLLTHHRKLGRWLQPGGHADGDADLAAVALREAQEETGLLGLRIEPAIHDLDRHWIPERGDEPGHWHYDVRFLVHAGAREDFVVSAESDTLAWWPLAEVAVDPRFDPSLRRMAGRWVMGQDRRCEVRRV